MIQTAPMKTLQSSILRSAFLLAILLILAASAAAQEPCGGVERWSVKMAADSDSSQINRQPINISIHDIGEIEKGEAIPADETERLPTERSVYVVDGFLVKFKLEAGKKGDSDYHLVVTDETLTFAPDSHHSVIAEIVDPDCVEGRKHTVSSPTVFASEMATAKAALEAKFPNRAEGSGWTDGEGIPVRITGVGFFDRPHGQTGRAPNGIELHPVLSIEFNPTGGPSPGPAPAAATTMPNSGFEDGQDPWKASDGVISNDRHEPARNGSFKAWLGGYGEEHTDDLCREITIPASASAASISFFLHISTEEQTTTAALDTLEVQVRRPSNSVLKTLATFSNLQAKPGFQLRTYDLTPFKGQTVKFCLSSREDAGSVTSFVADDFSFVTD
jgi:hypothetical protein